MTTLNPAFPAGAATLGGSTPFRYDPPCYDPSHLEDWFGLEPTSGSAPRLLPIVQTSVSYQDFLITVTGPRDIQTFTWFRPTIEAMTELLELPPGWNSYGAKQIQAGAVEKIIEVLLNILDRSSATPAVVPTSLGGVQVEWHRSGIDFEIEADSFGRLQYFFSSPNEELEGPIEDDPSYLKGIVQKYL